MTSISGKTTNGFTYEGDYERPSADRATWAATYRRSGVFFGMRHGRINELLGVPDGEVNEAVQDDIEFAWVQSS
ncbi:TonB-dependent receptor [Dyella sp.]|uniref:TonB-dependent receptor n=1 Tax=Dyella sp. TaxID=1869338 RepID=UPI00283B8AC9|nr:TonB-dependent receptor [Dyella sp.]MDR3446691.1 TonB-dependent receptor [Dyella sp.]